MYAKLFYFICLALLLQSCAASRQARQLTQHQNGLARMAASNASPEEKMDFLAKTYVEVMHQTLNILNPEKAVEYATKFGDQNKNSIQKISGDIAKWQQNLNGLEVITLAARMVSKPYTKELIDLIPRIKSKYNQLKFLYELENMVKLENLIKL